MSALAFGGCDSKPKDVDSQEPMAQTIKPPTKKEVVKTDVKVGTGLVAEKGDIVFMTYSGKLANGTVFDSNDKPTANPFSFTIGDGSVIKGWDLGIEGMKVGGERRLEIPSALAYGPQSPPGSSIPPNSDLFFDVKLLDMVKRGEENVYDKKDLKVGSGRAAAMGNTVTIHYVAKLVNNKEIDSTYKRKKSESFELGKGDVIKGLEYGIAGMKVGGKRWLRIPPNIGYGAYGMNNVPGNNIVLFEVELLAVK